jgi:hypothetical protein
VAGLGFPFIFTHGYRLMALESIPRIPGPIPSGAVSGIQGLVAFANGGVWGMGLGQGLQKLKYFLRPIQTLSWRRSAKNWDWQERSVFLHFSAAGSIDCSFTTGGWRGR